MNARARTFDGQASLFDLPEAATPVPHRHLIGAVELSRRLGHPHPPTAEQCRAIEHRDADGGLGPYLIVAGAGSGKTETMAARVVWLVANRLVRPERILGLTFTRKAAGELAERVQRRLTQLARSGVLAPAASQDPLDDDWLAGTPVVGTYHSYAAGLFSEHGLRLGREPSARLLGEALTWQVAGRVVDSYDGDMSAITWSSPATVVGAVRGLAGDLAEHLAGTEALRRLTDRQLALVDGLPAGKGGGRAEITRFLSSQRARLALLPLVDAYAQRKLDTDSLDYGDQVSLAAALASGHPEVVQGERARYDVVLLDEYQDTGSAQRSLLTSLYGDGHAVTAVGDPCQSIYGWRGASAGNLRRFPADFRDRSGRPGDQVDLTVSFRNGGRILTVANALSAPLRHAGVPVSDLVPGPTRGPDSGEVVYALHEDAVAEAAWMADEVAALLSGGDGGSVPAYVAADVAVLARARSQFPRLEEALRARGIPVEVSGLGGLLATPEVVDAMATLSVVADPGAGTAMLRILTGSRWRLGPRDLAALARRARALAQPLRDRTDVPAGEVTVTVPPGDAVDAAAGLAHDEEADAQSLVEAVDDPGPPDAYSRAGWERITTLRSELRSLRARLDQPLPDLLADIVRTTRLDVEVAARPGRDPSTARGHLDRFLDVAAEFSDAEESPTVASFLAYLAAAEEYERGLDAGRVGLTGEAVQLVTIHGAKGLEWPVVVLAGLTKDVFPGRGRGGIDWCRDARVLPFPLRGDADDLPFLDLSSCTDQREVNAALKIHEEAVKDRVAQEERRLMYVATTRARDVLICSGYWWDFTTKARGPSLFLTEVREACEAAGIGRCGGWADPPDDGAQHPLDRSPLEGTWPADPLGSGGRTALEAGAALVAAAMARTAAGDSATAAAPAPAAADPVPTSVGPDEVAPGATRLDVDAGPPLTSDESARAAVWRDEVGKLVDERRREGGTDGVIDVPLPGPRSACGLVRAGVGVGGGGRQARRRAAP